MSDNDSIFNNIAEALLVDYSSVYYVDAITNEYQWYSINPEFNSLKLEHKGQDFFENLAIDVEKYIYKDDRHLFIGYFTKERLLKDMKEGNMKSLEYRLMIDDRPVYHTLRFIREIRDEEDYFIFGVINVDKEVRLRREREMIDRERHIFNQIANSLAGQYDTLFYVNIEKGNYFEFSSKDRYKNLQIPTQGSDFFEMARKNIKKYAHQDDMNRLLNIYNIDEIIKKLEKRNTYTTTFSIILNDHVEYCRNTIILADDEKHIIVCIENITDEVSVEREFIESQKQSITFGQIAESLASHYDLIYYVDSIKGNYTAFKVNDMYGNLEIEEEGSDFFYESERNAPEIIFNEDLNRLLGILNKDYIISSLEDKKRFSADYRMIIDGQLHYTRMTIMWSGDNRHFIIGIENIDEEIRKENEYLTELQSANERAVRDEMTGVRNKNAYQEYEFELQKRIEYGDNNPFALVICDINDLKLVNDTLGHKAGDNYIKSACRMICDVFKHSPVFRIGGDEFAVILFDRDYNDREKLLDELKCLVEANRAKGEGPVVAAGICEYEPDRFSKVSEIFEIADSRMYDNKRKLKERV